MKLSDLRIAYQLQRKFLNGKDIAAYKVGASNYRSAEFFNSDIILLGGIERKNIFNKTISKKYPIAEVEIISRVAITDDAFEVVSQFIGVECPDLVVENPDGSPFLCVADNCSAGDLIIFQEVKNDYYDSVRVFRNGELISSGSSENMKFSIHKIISETVALIREHSLPLCTDAFLIATGGLTDVFSLDANDSLEIVCE